ncbi:MAG: helix-turn-helix transcriptional regulator, partial [Myxococcota bacterium]|nr:helix-turn-helix transcriptional regulator [Myxococcota bacterium]
RDPIAGAEAVFAPGGNIVHAIGAAQRPAAREALRQAAIDIDRARTSNVRGTDEALELWRALHLGRWSVLDTFDTDGRRFLVARENAPAADPAPSLSRREQQVLDLLALGHSNKVIAYDLGISVSSVATHLRRAATKLGVVGTRELIRWARMRARPRDEA